MSIIEGGIAYSPTLQGTTDLYYLVDSMNGYSFDYWPTYASELEVTLIGESYTNNLPISAATNSPGAGIKAPSYLDDYYYRVHLNIYSLNLGNVLSNQTYILEIWNAWFINDTLNTITNLDLADISLSLPKDIPYTFKPLEYISGTINIVALGTPTIDGSFTFNFATEIPILNITGQRVILWSFAPQTTFTESRAWLTDIIPAKSAESRYSVREIPRLTLSYKYVFRTQQEYALAKLKAKTIANLAIATPLWTDLVKLTNLTITDTVIALTTTNLELEPGSIVMFWENYDNFELKEISALTSSTITLTQGLEKSHSSCWLAPVYIGYPKDGINLNRGEAHSLSSNISCEITKCYNNPTWASPEMYLSLPIFTTGNIVTGGLQERFSRAMEVFDSDTGAFAPFDIENYTRNQQALRIKAQGNAEIYTIRRFLDYLKGKYNAFWLPSFMEELQAEGDISLGGNTLKVKYAQWSDYTPSHIRVHGSVIANFEVLASANNNDGTETLLLSPSSSVVITNITKIELLTKVRLNSDSIELNHEPKLFASLSTTVIEVKA